MKFFKNGKPKFIVAFTAAILIVISSLVFMNISIRQNLSSSTFHTLEEIMQQQKYNFTSKLKGELSLIKDLAFLIAPMDNIEDVSLETLSFLTNNTNFEYLTISDVNGNAINNAGIKTTVKDFSYFKDTLKGKTVISEPVMSGFRNVKVIIISAPIKSGDKVIGALMGSYTAESLNELFLSSFDGKGYAYITNHSGDIIAETRNDYSLTTMNNLFESWTNADFYEYDDFETVKNNLLNNKSGHAKYELNGQTRLTQYAKVGINDWDIFSIVPDDVISESANKIIVIVYSLTILFVLVFALLIIFIFSMQRKHIKELLDIAFVDDLTGAPTLAKFKLDAQKLIDENPGKKYLLIKKDIDRFKLINQTLGFEMGDKVLINVINVMKENICKNKETYTRSSKDEFLYLHAFKSHEHLLKNKQVFLESFKKEMGDTFAYKINFPTGYYYLELEDCKDISAAIEKVNIAHYKAKQSGIEECVYNEQMIKEELEIKNIENKMEDALKNKEFKMFLQPKRYLKDESIAGAEALARWWINGKFIMHPADFVPIFEKNGFVTKLDMYMFEEACKFIRNLIDSGKKPLTISVNFSRLHLNNEQFVEILCEIADRCKAPREYLEIEITETAIFENEEILNEVLQKLHKENFTLSMDDFGTGFSSLGLLKSIDFDVIKIDRSFFVDTKKPERSKTVLSNVIKMAKDLGIHTVAEGVELKEQIDLLKELGCDMVQGYYYAKPMPFEELFSDI